MHRVALLLPDPRRYGASGGGHPFNLLGDRELRNALRDALTGSRDAEIVAALRAAPTREAYARLWNAVCEVTHHCACDQGPEAVVARVFALPLVIVTGSRRPAILTGMLPDIDAVRSLFEQHGVLGSIRNFGIGNALCSLDALEQVAPSEIFAWTSATGNVQRELAPCPIELSGPGEQVHLRFLVGAGITPGSAPSLGETASGIVTWGLALTRALVTQLARAGVDVLAMPRPPLDFLRAAHAGRMAQLEAAWNLFVSNSVRRFRGATGDPVAVISAHDDGEIRVGFSSPFDDAMLEGFRWPLHPLDTIDLVTGSITGLLEACRVNDVRYVDRVLPALDAQGRSWFAKAGDATPCGIAPLRH